MSDIEYEMTVEKWAQGVIEQGMPARMPIALIYRFQTVREYLLLAQLGVDWINKICTLKGKEILEVRVPFYEPYHILEITLHVSKEEILLRKTIIGTRVSQHKWTLNYRDLFAQAPWEFKNLFGDDNG